MDELAALKARVDALEKEVAGLRELIVVSELSARKMVGG
jgi:cell division protein FtsB